MTYIIAPLLTLILALLGAFYKNTQKKIDGDPVYWHWLPVLTPIGWVLVTALFLSSAISAYSTYQKAARDVREKADETRRMSEVALVGRSSPPQMNLFFAKEGVVQDFSSMMNEKHQSEDIADASIGFIPQSVREVLFPFSDNSPKHDSTQIGHIDFRIGGFGSFSTVDASGHVGRAFLTFNSIIGLETVLPNPGGQPDNKVRLIFQFAKNWVWEDLNQSLNNAFLQGTPIIIIYREHVPTAPARPPSFTHFGLVMVLSKHPAFNISLSLEPKNYVYDSQAQSYSYELHISQAPEIITRPLDP